jgi:hypothetical protein
MCGVCHWLFPTRSKQRFAGFSRPKSVDMPRGMFLPPTGAVSS